MSQYALLPEEIDTLANHSRGFYQQPDPSQLKAVMGALDPRNVLDLVKLTELKEAHGALSEGLSKGQEVHHVCDRVRELLGFPVTQQEQLDRWYYIHPVGM